MHEAANGEFNLALDGIVAFDVNFHGNDEEDLAPRMTRFPSCMGIQ